MAKKNPIYRPVGWRWRGRPVEPNPVIRHPRRRNVTVQIREVGHSHSSPPFRVRGWFGDHENGHIHLTLISPSRSFASVDYLLDHMRSEELHHFMFFQVSNDDWMDEMALVLCEHNFRAWTSFFLSSEQLGSLLCFATHETTDFVKLMLAIPTRMMEARISLDEEAVFAV